MSSPMKRSKKTSHHDDSIDEKLNVAIEDFRASRRERRRFICDRLQCKQWSQVVVKTSQKKELRVIPPSIEGTIAGTRRRRQMIREFVDTTNGALLDLPTMIDSCDDNKGYVDEEIDVLRSPVMIVPAKDDTPAPTVVLPPIFTYVGRHAAAVSDRQNSSENSGGAAGGGGNVDVPQALPQRPVTDPPAERQFPTFRRQYNVAFESIVDNDYQTHSVAVGETTTNFINTARRDLAGTSSRLDNMSRVKAEAVAAGNEAPVKLHADLRQYKGTGGLHRLLGGMEFDVILIEPPVPGCSASTRVADDVRWSWKEVSQLDIRSVAASRCFVWMWAGHGGPSLDEARDVMKSWKMRRCEDICWLDSAPSVSDGATNADEFGRPSGRCVDGVLVRRKEHCLMSMTGTVRRNEDTDFIRANLDVDVIIAPSYESSNGLVKPTELFSVIERFCLGKRRLHLFANEDSTRSGWVSVGLGIDEQHAANKNGDTFDIAALSSSLKSKWAATGNVVQLPPEPRSSIV